MKTFKILSRIAMLIVALFTINACTTSDLDPTLSENKLIKGGITSQDNLYALIKGAYDVLTEDGYYGRDYIINNEVRGDNCFSNGNSGRFTTQAGFTYNENTGYMWDEAYRAIASCNIIIAQTPAELEGTEAYIKYLQGQAYALRALVHFDLVKQYGQQHVGGTLGVPYVTEFKGDDIIPARNTVEEVKTKVMADLNTAYGLMDDSFDGSSEFITKLAVKAIQSRVAVYFEMWDEAIAACEIVIGSGDYSIIEAKDYVSHWKADQSANSIFELAFNSSDNEGINGLAYIYRTTEGGSYGDIQVIDEVEDLYEVGDVRADILGFEGDMLRNIGKYPNNKGEDNVIIIRYEEVILNYAEALLETGGDALTQINLITSKRNASAYTAVTKDDILVERRKELIFEGHRFEDLTRMGKDMVKFSIQQNFAETIPYGDFRLAYPIPKAEMDANSNMVQNQGY